MELAIFNIVEKLGSDNYSLWTGKWPRTRVHEIRQKSPVIEGDLARVFDEITPVRPGRESLCNIILPDSKNLKLFRTDMGEQFMERRYYNGTITQGTKVEIMTALQAELHSRGYTPRPNAYFQNADVLATLQKIVDQNTDFYRTDFGYDREMLTKAAESRNGNTIFFGSPAEAERPATPNGMCISEAQRPIIRGHITAAAKVTTSRPFGFK